MPAELWDVGTWASPSGEAAVRARVHRRAKGILRMRVAMAAVVAVLSAAIVADLPGGRESGVRMKTDTEWNGADQPPTVDSGPPASAPDRAEPKVSVGAPAPNAEAPPLSPVEPAPPGSFPAVASAAGPVVLDAIGDAHYQTGCSSDACPDDADVDRGSPSQPLYDVTSLALPCPGRAIEVRLGFADLDTAPTPNLAGMRPTYASYHVGMVFRDEARTLLTFGLNWDLASGELWVGGVVSFYVGEDNYHTFLTPSVRREGDTWVLRVDDFVAAVDAAYRGTAPPREGTLVDGSVLSIALYREDPKPQVTQGVDQIQIGSPGSTFRWCRA